jgi:hypothetical protein
MKDRKGENAFTRFIRGLCDDAVDGKAVGFLNLAACLSSRTATFIEEESPKNVALVLRALAAAASSIAETVDEGRGS